MTNIKFPKHPTQGQLHEGYVYINREWLRSHNTNQYELIRAATKQGMKDYEEEKEMLFKAATQALHSQNQKNKPHKEQ